MSKKQGILAEILKEYGSQGESIPENLKQEIKGEASFELASRIEKDTIPADPETIGELVEAWLIILSHKAREKGIRTQLSWARIKSNS